MEQAFCAFLMEHDTGATFPSTGKCCPISSRYPEHQNESDRLLVWYTRQLTDSKHLKQTLRIRIHELHTFHKSFSSSDLALAEVPSNTARSRLPDSRPCLVTSTNARGGGVFDADSLLTEWGGKNASASGSVDTRPLVSVRCLWDFVNSARSQKGKEGICAKVDTTSSSWLYTLPERETENK